MKKIEFGGGGGLFLKEASANAGVPVGWWDNIVLRISVLITW